MTYFVHRQSAIYGSAGTCKLNGHYACLFHQREALNLESSWFVQLQNVHSILCRDAKANPDNLYFLQVDMFSSLLCTELNLYGTTEPVDNSFMRTSEFRIALAMNL